MIIPVFGKLEKAPNNTTVGLSRGASIAVKAAAASDTISGKPGESLSVWTEGCTIIFVGVGDKEKLTHKGARDAGAKCLAKLQATIVGKKKWRNEDQKPRTSTPLIDIW